MAVRESVTNPLATVRQRALARPGGFTLLELTVVILLLGVLAAFLLPAVIGVSAGARQELTLTRIHDLETALAA